MANEVTPCFALFSAMTKLGGISYKELAGIILSGKPLSDGRSPVSRINDRTWISRFVVHAPVGSLQDRYFCEFSVSALRIIARLKSRSGKGLSSREIVDLVTAEEVHGMEKALSFCHQNVTLYHNTLERIIHGPGMTADERAEAAMVLFVSAGCLANVHRTVEYTMKLARSTHAGRLTTPTDVAPAGSEEKKSILNSKPILGLLRIVDGYVVGSPYWLSDTEEGTEIGALALSNDAINDVGSHASGRHARIWNKDERWFIEDLGSSNGTTVVSGANHEETVVGSSSQGKPDAPSAQIELHPGDEIRLADDTVFVVIEGMLGV